MGHRVLISPVLRIAFDPDIVIPEKAYQAIAITSANGSRALAGNPALPRLLKLPVFTVGLQSAEAATEIGFTNVEATGGNVSALAARMRVTLNPRLGPILYLSGQDIAGDLAGMLAEHGFDVERAILYKAAPAWALESKAVQALSGGEIGGVLLYSQRSARIWRSLIESAGLTDACRTVRHYCLSSKVAAALAPAYRTIAPERPDEAALLALLDPAR
jgi:uroporphyrinogen-III synthase